MPSSSGLVNTKKFFLSSLVTADGSKGSTPAASMKDIYLQSTLAILETRQMVLDMSTVALSDRRASSVLAESGDRCLLVSSFLENVLTRFSGFFESADCPWGLNRPFLT